MIERTGLRLEYKEVRQPLIIGGEFILWIYGPHYEQDTPCFAFALLRVDEMRYWKTFKVGGEHEDST